jgi:hypothetical protein
MHTEHAEAERTFFLGIPSRRTNQEDRMAKVYIEPRPKGRKEGEPIEDYVVEDHADHVLTICKTQQEAIDWGRSHGHDPAVARVRHLNDKKIPDHWRSVLRA